VGCSVTITANGPGEDFYRPDPGQIIFGTDLDPTFMYVKDKLTTIKQGDGKLAFVGSWSDMISGQMTIMMSIDGAPAKPAGGFDYKTPGNWFSGKYNLSELPGPGHYAVSYVQGDKTLAAGEFDLAP
jgi:hypothetical protein